jgi:hypothetical protein
MSAKTSRTPKTSTVRRSILRAGFASILLIGIALAPTTLRAGTTPPSRIDCDAAVPLTPGETWRDPGAQASGACFLVDVDETGILVAELLLPATQPRAHLMLLEADAPASARLRQSATTLVLAAEPGRYSLGVKADNPEERLGPFRLWIDLAVPEPSPSLRREVGKGENDTEIELEPNPVVVLCPFDPSTGRCPPAPTAATPSRIRPLEPYGPVALCRRAAARDVRDDFGDTFSCATSLVWGTELRGELANDWGDDSDVFRFEVPSLRPVEVAARLTEGNGELVAELYDRFGQRLELMVGEGAGVRRVRTLVPGTYFLRLEGRDHAEGGYSLHIGPPR